MAVDRQFSIQTTDGDTPRVYHRTWVDALTWRGLWVPGTEYPNQSVVRDDEWTMVSNKVTSARPGVFPTGNREWVGHGDTPAWINETSAAIAVISGQRYTVGTVPFFVKAARVWIDTTPNMRYEVWGTFNPDDPNPEIRQLADIPNPPTETGWIDVPTEGSIALPGAVFELLLVAFSNDGPVSFAGDWLQVNSNGAPSAGETYWQNNQQSVRIHHIDADAIDRKTQLEAVPVGGEINVAGTDYLVDSVTLNASDVQYFIQPTSRPPAGLYTYTFNYGSLANVPYVEILDHYAGLTTVQSVFSDTGYGNIVLGNNAHGVDIEIDTVEASPDWDIMSYSALPTLGAAGGEPVVVNTLGAAIQDTQGNVITDTQGNPIQDTTS